MERAVLGKDDVDIFRWECGESGTPTHCSDNLAVLQKRAQAVFGWGGQGF